MQDWKTWDQVAGVEKAGLENTRPNRRGGKGRTAKRRTKFLGWKTLDHRLWNAKWISIKTKGTLYHMICIFYYKYNIIRHYNVVQSAEMQYMSNVKCRNRRNTYTYVYSITNII